MQPIAKSFLALSLLGLVSISQAEDRTHYEEPGLTAGREYLKQEFAEKIDPFSGNLTLQYVDLFIPGSGGFDLRVQRSYNTNAIGEALSPFGRGWQIHFGRVSHVADQACAGATPQTMALELPDGSQQTFHRSNGVAGTLTSDYLTTSFWKGQCNGSGVGITAFSPDGTKFDMSESDGPY